MLKHINSWILFLLTIEPDNEIKMCGCEHVYTHTCTPFPTVKMEKGFSILPSQLWQKLSMYQFKKRDQINTLIQFVAGTQHR